MIVQIRQIDRAPEGAVVHFCEPYSYRESFAHARLCGTFGYDMIHSDKLAHVTCRRCLAKLKNKVEN